MLHYHGLPITPESAKAVNQIFNDMIVRLRKAEKQNRLLKAAIRKLTAPEEPRG